MKLPPPLPPSRGRSELADLIGRILARHWYRTRIATTDTTTEAKTEATKTEHHPPSAEGVVEPLR